MRWTDTFRLFRRRLVTLSAWCVAAIGAHLHGAPAPQLTIQPSAEFGWHRIAGTADASHVYTIEGSSNLTHWRAIATLIDAPGEPPATNASFSFLDPASSLLSGRFYRATSSPVASTNDWKNQIGFPLDAFEATNGFGQPRWI